MNSRLRILVVAAILLAAHLISLPDMGRIFGLVESDYGFASDGRVVTRIDSGGAAARAGLRSGDRIAIDDRSRAAQYMLVRGIGYYPGARLTLHVRTPEGFRTVTLLAAPESTSTRALVALRFFLAFLTIGVATALLLTRPSPAAWGFFLYCSDVIALPGSFTSIYATGLYRTIVFSAAMASGVAASFGGVLFAWAFANEPWTWWRRAAVALAAAPGVALIALIALTALPGAFTRFDPSDAIVAFEYLAIALMIAGFIDALLHDGGPSRQRLKWMITAILITLPCYYVSQNYFPERISYGTFVALIATQSILPLFAAYAMFRKRVVDVRFVISRTFVYGAITAAIAGCFSILDEMLARSYETSRWGLIIDIVIAIAIGFSLDAMRERIDNLIDAALFRERRRAETRLRNTSSAIAHASDPGAVAAAIVDLPVDLLKLGGAVFYKPEGGAFVAQAAAGGGHSYPARIESNDLLVLALQAQRVPVTLEDVARTALHELDAAVAVPLLVRGDLSGFCVYGAHKNGLAIDAGELGLLAALAQGASTAFDHNEAQELRERVAILEKRLNEGRLSC